MVLVENVTARDGKLFFMLHNCTAYNVEQYYSFNMVLLCVI